ncbi:MAG TPA: septum site-determining protein Ssd [Actinomycetales bacterium]|nr:septum site-determining protein Ssd [Actinomycetales bacterium]
MEAERSESVLLVTQLQSLVGVVTTICAAVGLRVEVRGDLERCGGAWLSAPLVLLGEDAAALGLPVRRPGLVVVTTSPGERFWRTALENGAEQALVLPADQELLVARLAEVADPSPRRASVVGVLGGRGGAGASTLAACLALTAAADRDVLFVDGDPLGSGLDSLFDVAGAGGLRWSDLDGLEGPVRGSSLRQALPVVSGVSLLSWGCGPSAELRREPVEAVLDAARRHVDVVVVDLARSFGPAGLAAVSALDTLLLLVPAEVRAVLSAARVLARVRPLVPDVRLVVRGPSPGGLDGEQVASALDLPLSAWLAPEPRLDRVLERGELPSRRGPLMRFCAGFLQSVGAGPASGVAGMAGAAGVAGSAGVAGVVEVVA